VERIRLEKLSKQDRETTNIITKSLGRGQDSIKSTLGLVNNGRNHLLRWVSGTFPHRAHHYFEVIVI